MITDRRKLFPIIINHYSYRCCPPANRMFVHGRVAARPELCCRVAALLELRCHGASLPELQCRD